MKILLPIFLLIFCVGQHIAAQASVEAQVGGANFLGLSINSRYAFPLNEMHDQSLSPSFGIGMLVPGWDVPTVIINTGISYTIKSWGIGTEISAFMDAPFTFSNTPRDFADMIIYPNLNYTHTIGNSWYFRVSAGPYFAYSKKLKPGSEKYVLQYEGDVIPGAGIGIGYSFK